MLDPTPKTKAFTTTLGFLLAGIIGWTNKVEDPLLSLPLLIFYAILLVNTYYSIKFFSTLTPRGKFHQYITDSALVLLYIALAFSMNVPYDFVFLSMLVFIVAIKKYTFLISLVPHITIIKKKILIDALGAFGCAIILEGIHLGYTEPSLWLFAAAFALANILLFFVWPLYSFGV